jgi:class 3 adenylate cyclase
MADASADAILAAEAERARALLRRYLSPRVAEAVLTETRDVHDIGEASDVSVLFCDLRGFTRIAESHPPVTVAHRLNEFLDEMTQVIFRYEGMLDKYTGDGLLAVFGVPYSDPFHVQRAVHAAVEMQARHAHILERWRQDGWGDLALGIGLDSGEAIAGNFGSAQRADYTVIGHVVNVAARLTAKAPPGHILLSDRTRRRAKDLIETVPMGVVELKNVSEAIPVCSLLGLKAPSPKTCSICGNTVHPGAEACPICASPLTLLDAPIDRYGLRTVAAIASTRTTRGRVGSPHLIAVAGPHQGSDFRLALPSSIGREALTNQIVLSLDSAVSRRHAAIRAEDGQIVLADLGSQNGTYVNNRRVHAVRLREGDMISIGHSRLVVSELDAALSEERP